MDIGLLVTFAGIAVAGLAGVLGVWMERDPGAPPRWAWVFSAFIVVAAAIEGTHSLAQAAEDGETEEQMASVLEKLTEIAAKGDDPALQQFVGAELAAQSRSNPRVMKRLEKKVSAKGGDPTALRRQASEGRRAAAGLPPRTKAKAGTGARVAAPGGVEGKAGKADPGQLGKTAGDAGKTALEGKAGKAAGDAASAEAAKATKAAGDAAGKAAGDAAGKAAGDAAGKAAGKAVEGAVPGLGGKK